MKKHFPGYHSCSEDKLKELWDTAIFVFDTNILLHLYEYSETSRNELLTIFNKLNGRVWLPHQVASEFYKDRENVIHKIDNVADDIKKFLEGLEKSVKQFFKDKNQHPYIKFDDIQSFMDQKIKSLIRETRKKLDNYSEKRHQSMLANDTLLPQIEQIFDEKIGESYSREELFKIYEIGKLRYADNIPPGYKDTSKNGIGQFGDLVLWFQIIDVAKQKKTPIIFVTDDTKEDWWEGNREKKDRLRPRSQLSQEIYNEAKVNFLMYHADSFLQYARKYFDTRIDESIINEARQVRENDEKSNIPTFYLQTAQIDQAMQAIWGSQTAQFAQIDQVMQAIFDSQINQMMQAIFDSQINQVMQVIFDSQINQMIQEVIKPISEKRTQINQAIQEVIKPISEQIAQGVQAIFELIPSPTEQIAQEFTKPISESKEQMTQETQHIKNSDSE